jgi:hypothetical protein
MRHQTTQTSVLTTPSTEYTLSAHESLLCQQLIIQIDYDASHQSNAYFVNKTLLDQDLKLAELSCNNRIEFHRSRCRSPK